MSKAVELAQLGRNLDYDETNRDINLGTGKDVLTTDNTTDDLPEGTNHRYHHNDLTRAAISASSDGLISYDSGTGIITGNYPTTLNIAENTNQYFTTARARDSVSAETSGYGSLTYSTPTGVFTYTGPTDADIQGAISVSGSLGYSGGVISYTEPTYDTDDIPEASSPTNLYFTTDRVDLHLSGGTGVTYTTGDISIGQSVGTTDNVTFGTVTADLTGNADTATSLETTRSIALTGDVTGTANFNGTANASIATTIAANSVALGTDTTGNYMSGVSAGTDISVTHTAGEGSTATVTNTSTLDSVTDRGATTTNDVSVGNITTSGYLRGPASFTIDPAGHGDNTGTVVIAGNLQIDGTTTTVNSATLAVADLNMVLADGAANAAAANGAGLTVDGANATITYDSTSDEWDFNKGINVTGPITVSSTVDGRDIATDGSKLDGIESNATADQTAAQILTAIKTVDGTTSGLDADLLDGVHATSFLRSDAADVATGDLRLAGTTTFGTASQGYIQGAGTTTSSLHRIKEITFNAGGNTWNDSVVHGINSTSETGAYSDSLSINSYNHLTLRLDSNNNNTASYLRVYNNTSDNSTAASFWTGNDGTANKTKVDGYLGVGVNPNNSGSYRLNMGGAIDMNNYSIDYVTQLHFNDNVRFLDEGNDSYLRFKWGDTGAGGIKFLDGGNQLQGFVYGTGEQHFGLLSAAGEWAVRIENNGLTELRHDGTAKLQTTSTGVDVTGALTVNGTALVSGLNYTESASPPSSPANGDEWYDTGEDILYKRISGNWLQLSPSGGVKIYDVNGNEVS